MTGNTNSHLTARSRNDGIEIARTYAITDDIARELGGTRDWLLGYIKLTGKDLLAWLEYKGCVLDCPDGPAVVRRSSDGSIYEEYCRNGKLHRENGPAVVWRSATGATEESYYREGKRHRDDGPAFVRRGSDGVREERHYRDGELHRKGGPAVVTQRPDGVREERYYLDGALVKKRRRAAIAAFPA
jgi:hypothetical protein